MKKGYDINTKIDFGMYKGYELGIVYAFDPTYLEWCIINIDYFYIENITELSKYNIVYKSSGYQEARDYNFPKLHILIDEYKSIQDLNQNSGINTIHFAFSNESKFLNEEKRKKQNH